MLNSEISLADPDPQTHFVQLYEADEGALVRNASRFLAAGLEQGNNLVVIATADHRAAILKVITATGADAREAERSGRLVLADAQETLARFMVEGYPDSTRFDGTVGALVRDALARADGSGLRAYGEMVGVLWKARQFPSAIRLEQLWNQLRKSSPFSLFCSYPIDIFDAQFEAGVLDALLCAHTHLLPAADNTDLENAIRRAMSDVVGHGNDDLRSLVPGDLRTAWPTLPMAEAMILWLRSRLPDSAEAILARARQYYHAAA
jgi:hypothetical protein